jgi:hypothetical protein
MRSKLPLPERSESALESVRLHGGHGWLCSTHSARNPGMEYGTVNYDSSAPEYDLAKTLV